MRADFQMAEFLAADLAGSRVDPNEVQKALAYLRTKNDAKLFFGYLRAINQNGRAVIRSGQTLGYYRDLLAACERHLRGMEAGEMAQTLGWAIRLLRYYRAVPNAEIIRPARAQQDTRALQRDETVPQQQAPAAATRQPAAPRLPAVGDTFVGAVIAVDESAVLVGVPGFGEEQAIGVISADALGGRTDRYRVGNSARVEVIGVRTLKNGRTVLMLKPAKRQETPAG